jgi:cobalt/nickel transport system permease protein
MHIADGFLPASVCAGGYATAAAVTWYALRTLKRQENTQEGIPKAALLAAAFFVISWIHIPIPPTTVHILFIGLMGMMLGYYAVPALLVALFFQAVMFQHGGLTTLGVNMTMFSVPALLVHHLFRLRHRVGLSGRTGTGVAAFLGAAVATGIAVLIMFTILITNIPAHVDAALERTAIVATVVAHIPLMLVEGIVTAMVVLFVQRVRPELLEELPPPSPVIGIAAPDYATYD